MTNLPVLSERDRRSSVVEGDSNAIHPISSKNPSL